jgi:hypothetical protein
VDARAATAKSIQAARSRGTTRTTPDSANLSKKQIANLTSSRCESAQIVSRRFGALECGGGSDHIVFAKTASNNLKPDRHSV